MLVVLLSLSVVTCLGAACFVAVRLASNVMDMMEDRGYDPLEQMLASAAILFVSLSIGAVGALFFYKVVFNMPEIPFVV